MYRLLHFSSSWFLVNCFSGKQTRGMSFPEMVEKILRRIDRITYESGSDITYESIGEIRELLSLIEYMKDYEDE